MNSLPIRFSHNQPQRGFTLLIAIILASVSLLIGLALADVAYRQVILSSTARNSQVAFYRADSAMECALYYDQKFAAFNQVNTFNPTDVRCEGRSPVNYNEAAYSGGWRTTFQIPCAGSGVSASVEIHKNTTQCAALGKVSCMYTSGYSTCSATNPNRFERGLKVVY